MNTEVQNSEVTQEAAPVAQEAQEQKVLTINDLQVLAQIIDVATARGTFKPNELVNVGTVYNKLTAFLASIKAATEQKEAGNQG